MKIEVSYAIIQIPCIVRYITVQKFNSVDCSINREREDKMYNQSTISRIRISDKDIIFEDKFEDIKTNL